MVADCVAIEDRSTRFMEQLVLLDAEDAVRYRFTSPMTRGHGIVRADVTWSSYSGAPSVGFADEEGASVLAQLFPEDAPVAVAEAMLGAGDTVFLAVEQFAAAREQEYPIVLDVELSFEPLPDCWEDNDNQETAARIELDSEVEAWLGGTFAAYPEDAFWYLSQDDHYLVTIPRRSSSMTVQGDFSASEGSIEVTWYAADATPESRQTLMYLGGTNDPTGSVTVDVEPGDYIVYVRKWEDRSPFDAWATKEPGEVERPDYWDTPYHLTVSASN